MKLSDNMSVSIDIPMRLIINYIESAIDYCDYWAKPIEKENLIERLDYTKDILIYDKDEEKQIGILNLCRIQRGFKLLIEKRPEILDSIINGYLSDEDCDEFYQYCVMGKCIY